MLKLKGRPYQLRHLLIGVQYRVHFNPTLLLPSAGLRPTHFIRALNRLIMVLSIRNKRWSNYLLDGCYAMGNFTQGGIIVHDTYSIQIKCSQDLQRLLYLSAIIGGQINVTYNQYGLNYLFHIKTLSLLSKILHSE